MYRNLLWFFLVGAALPVVVYVLRKRVFPQATWLRKVHVPLFMGGLNYIPPASGTNYGSWAIVGLLFGLVVKRRQAVWWRRYNFVLSSALDCSVAIAGIVIFFALFYTGVSKQFKWWGTEVHKVHSPPLLLMRNGGAILTKLFGRIHVIGTAAAI